MYLLDTARLGDWEPVIGHVLGPIQGELSKEERSILPPAREVFVPLELVQPSEVRVVILGQDPYPKPGQADGLAFSTRSDSLPSSLRNIQKEIARTFPDVAFTGKGCLAAWARQGILLINTTFTVVEGCPLSHKSLGWTRCVSAIIQHLETLQTPCVYLLFGKNAQRFAPPLTTNTVISTVHPSGQSCWRGFIGSNCFLEVNKSIKGEPIDWGF